MHFSNKEHFKITFTWLCSRATAWLFVLSAAGNCGLLVLYAKHDLSFSPIKIVKNMIKMSVFSLDIEIYIE